ncbi:CDP-glycerol glycerophosphotransferase family protein [Bacillus niameyensis]|uniref:CDP-glycerol glycerophosphotransferase family protein n=1 Tax=Bacillus niameyensis TaxID=1522308 RepID=UPI000785B4EE|nr:CDP-glycerol glycerophosphotransferase family protein [Bacillus niameyensis]
MDVYLKNYWLLNVEFIEAFSSLNYKNIPLPLLSNFYHYLDEELKSEMENPEFNSKQTFNESDIQPHFEKWLKPLRAPMQFKQGKLLINFDYLRFLPENYLQFSPQTTLVLTRWKAKELYQIPVISMKDFINNHSDKPSFIQKAEQLFENHDHHPVFGKREFQERFLSDIPKMIDTIEMCDSIFDHEPISAILVGTTEELTSRVLSLFAAIHGIPSFCLQHGLILGEEAYIPAFASNYLVYGQFEKDWYVQRGVSEEQIHIAGHPRYDSIFTNQHLNRQQVLKQLKLSQAKKTVLMATQPFNTDFYVELTNLIAMDPNIQVIIKPHPWEKAKNRTECYIELEKRYPQVKYVTTEIPLYSLIATSDIVVVANSTVGLEAMLLDKPVVVYKSPNANRDYPYFDSLGNLVLTNTLDIKKTIHSILTSTSSQKSAKQIREAFIASNYPIKHSTLQIQNIIQEFSVGEV